jgi:hypothetical protein
VQHYPLDIIHAIHRRPRHVSDRQDAVVSLESQHATLSIVLLQSYPAALHSLFSAEEPTAHHTQEVVLPLQVAVAQVDIFHQFGYDRVCTLVTLHLEELRELLYYFLLDPRHQGILFLIVPILNLVEGLPIPVVDHDLFSPVVVVAISTIPTLQTQ